MDERSNTAVQVQEQFFEQCLAFIHLHGLCVLGSDQIKTNRPATTHSRGSQFTWSSPGTQPSDVRGERAANGVRKAELVDEDERNLRQS